ncbi:hypothetical protein ABID22_002565 [Pontibacter aydingkolensis]|uniref:Uncharacterized protein n=1 Tax=Pontibacter aydingkolensis TaxID=1911536 RepID=A0ABS7CWF0_9BACT|nr:hypothetical protein [Pontibacter aydingkolensis]MBW7468103.1 hypothetical protein [Pontibacter aydingkolensis]
MITLSLFILLGLFIDNLPAENTRNYTLKELRNEYLQASKDEEAARRFHKKMAAFNEKQPVKLAYKASSEAVMAKYGWNPYNKLKHVKTAAAIFEEAVAMDRSHPEIRFLRFTVEHYIPRYLNLSEHIKEDKKLIIEGLKKHPKSGLSTEMAQTIKDFMLSKDHCTEAEKQEIKSIMIN